MHAGRIESVLFRRKLGLAAAVLALLLLVAAYVFFAVGETCGLFEVHVIEVGQGDAILVRTSGADMLIDAGPNSAEEALRIYLEQRDVRYLDCMILTHPDEDHIGGADMVLRSFGAEKVWLSPVTAEETSFDRLLEAASASGTEVLIGEAGKCFDLGEAEVTLLWPGVLAGASPNDASIVTRVAYGEAAVLLMGDASAEVEAMLLERCPPELLRADLLKLGHHGAATSTTDALLDTVAPVYAAVSCARANSFGHPARVVLDRLAQRGITVTRTDESGTLVFVSDGSTLAWKPSRHP